MLKIVPNNCLTSEGKVRTLGWWIYLEDKKDPHGCYYSIDNKKLHIAFGSLSTANVQSLDEAIEATIKYKNKYVKTKTK